jgi:hypothetical protein
MLEQISNLFYQPLVFWGVPLVLVVILFGLRRIRGWMRRRR